MYTYSQSYSMGRYGVNEGSILIAPRNPDPTRRAIIYAHGANGDATNMADYKTQKGLTKYFARLAAEGFVILSGDWGGPQTYGNDAAADAMAAGWAWLKESGLCSPDKVILTGGSMGMLTTSRFAADNPDEVAALNTWIPAIDADDLRETNALGLRDYINAAWGLPPGSRPSKGDKRVPYRGRVIDRAKEVEHIPTALWYSVADTATLPKAVLQYRAARKNVETHITSTTLNHSSQAIEASNIDYIVHWLKSYSVGEEAGVTPPPAEPGNNVFTSNFGGNF